MITIRGDVAKVVVTGRFGSAVGALFDDSAHPAFSEIDKRSIGVDIRAGLIAMEIALDVLWEGGVT